MTPLTPSTVDTLRSCREEFSPRGREGGRGSKQATRARKHLHPTEASTAPMATEANLVFASRAMDVANEDGGPRNPISAMFPSDAPVPSLADALLPLAGLYPKLQYPDGQLVTTALDHAELGYCIDNFAPL